MNDNNEHTDRGAVDLAAFAVVFFSFVLTAVGIVVNSGALTAVAILLMLLGLFYFRVMQN